jgi:hypothetical protein
VKVAARNIPATPAEAAAMASKAVRERMTTPTEERRMGGRRRAQLSPLLLVFEPLVLFELFEFVELLDLATDVAGVETGLVFQLEGGLFRACFMQSFN